MKRAIVTAFVVALALPLLAQQQDSVLVALAKRTGRLGKHPALVITNENLDAYAGRVSWATSDASDEVQPAASDKTAAKAPAAPAANATKPNYDQIIARTVNAPVGPVMQQPREGSSRAGYSEGTSTARDGTVTSSAVSETGASTAQNANVRSTASSTYMEQTAPATTPQAVPSHPVD